MQYHSKSNNDDVSRSKYLLRHPWKACGNFTQVCMHLYVMGNSASANTRVAQTYNSFKHRRRNRRRKQKYESANYDFVRGLLFFDGQPDAGTCSQQAGKKSKYRLELKDDTVRARCESLLFANRLNDR